MLLTLLIKNYLTKRHKPKEFKKSHGGFKLYVTMTPHNDMRFYVLPRKSAIKTTILLTYSVTKQLY